MNRKQTLWFSGAAALTLLLMGLFVAAPAQAGDTNDQHLTLTGQLAGDDQGNFLLIEEASGEAVILRGAVDFNEYLNQNVDVTGQWVEEPGGDRHFMVSEVTARETAS